LNLGITAEKRRAVLLVEIAEAEVGGTKLK
jgi:hypothetical protein